MTTLKGGRKPEIINSLISKEKAIKPAVTVGRPEKWKSGPEPPGALGWRPKFRCS
jgi:hypothetical protein